MPKRDVFLSTMDNIQATYDNDVVGNVALQVAARQEELANRLAQRDQQSGRQPNRVNNSSTTVENQS